MKKIALIALVAAATTLMAAPAAYSSCVGCHGTAGEKNTMVPNSHPNTMTKAQIIESINGYKAGTLNKYGKGALMKGMTARLTDAQIKEIADFIGK